MHVNIIRKFYITVINEMRKVMEKFFTVDFYIVYNLQISYVQASMFIIDKN